MVWTNQTVKQSNSRGRRLCSADMTILTAPPSSDFGQFGGQFSKAFSDAKKKLGPNFHNLSIGGKFDL